MARYGKTFKNAEIEFEDYYDYYHIITYYKRKFQDYAHWMKYFDIFEVNVSGRRTLFVPKYQVHKIFGHIERVRKWKPADNYYYLLLDFIIRTNCIWLMPNEYMAGQNTWINTIAKRPIKGKTPAQMTEADYAIQKELADYMRTDKLSNYDAQDRVQTLPVRQKKKADYIKKLERDDPREWC